MIPGPNQDQQPEKDAQVSGIPTWAWLVISCLLGMAVAVVILHLAGAARHLPG